MYEWPGSALHFQMRVLKVFIGGYKKCNERVRKTLMTNTFRLNSWNKSFADSSGFRVIISQAQCSILSSFTVNSMGGCFCATCSTLQWGMGSLWHISIFHLHIWGQNMENLVSQCVRGDWFSCSQCSKFHLSHFVDSTPPPKFHFCKRKCINSSANVLK